MNAKKPEIEIATCLSIKEVARLTGLSTDAVRRLIKAKDMPGAKIGKLWFVRENDLKTWVDAKFGN